MSTYELNVLAVADGEAKQSSTVRVEAEWLGGKVRSRLVHEACVMYEANRRTGTHKTKTRSEVNYTNKKPWRQKGTGRARAGTRRSPLWRGGGTIFGPQPRDYSYAMPRKARRRATQSALLSKLRDQETVVVDKLEAPSGRTKELISQLGCLGVMDGAVLLIVPEHDAMLVRAARNVPKVSLMTAADLNAYALIRNKKIVITERALSVALELFGASEKSAAEASDA